MSWLVLGMAVLRLLSGSLELVAGLLMIRLQQVEKALMINAMLAMVGPFVLITTTMLGLTGVAGKLSWDKLGWIVLGAGCMLYGVLRRSG